MKADDVRREFHRILDAHDTLLTTLRTGNGALQQVHSWMQRAFTAHDAALVSAIEANRAALALLNRITDEGGSMTLLEQIAQQRTNETLYTVISATIEKIAAEVARDLLKEPAFRAELKTAARDSLQRAVHDLRKPSSRRKRGVR